MKSVLVSVTPLTGVFHCCTNGRELWLGEESALFSRRCDPNMPDLIGYSAKTV